MPTADAPRARALKMSVPRRTPPSTMTGILPAAASRTIDRGAKSLFGAPTVIRDDQAVHTVLDRELRVFAGDDAFEEQLDGHSIAQPFHEIPTEIRGLRSSDLGQIEALEHRLPGCVLGEASRASSGPSPSVARVDALMASGTLSFIHTLSTE